MKVCVGCGEPHSGISKKRTWCTNFNCDYVWLGFERKGSAKNQSFVFFVQRFKKVLVPEIFLVRGAKNGD